MYYAICSSISTEIWSELGHTRQQSRQSDTVLMLNDCRRNIVSKDNFDTERQFFLSNFFVTEVLIRCRGITLSLVAKFKNCRPPSPALNYIPVSIKHLFTLNNTRYFWTLYIYSTIPWQPALRWLQDRSEGSQRSKGSETRSPAVPENITSLVMACLELQTVWV